MEFLVFALWLSVAILTGGHARTRGRDAWPWFVYTLFGGPLAVYLLVFWPPLVRTEPGAAPARDA